jgi:DNA-binding MarR family transcriptional regulator
MYPILVKELSRDKRRKVAEECIHYNLKRAVRVVTQRYDEALRPTGLHITQFTLLVSVSLFAPTPMIEAAEKLSLDQTTLSRNVQPLIKQGLLRLESSPTDSRSRLITLTNKGERAIAEAYPKWLEAQDEVIKLLGQGHYKRVLEATTTITGEKMHAN